MHRIGGPDEVCQGFVFPSGFKHNWLRPAPLNKEIKYLGVCRKFQANLCVPPRCPHEHVCAGCSGDHPLW
eukprot:7203202-Alexandrium_andersonii.AAC.1